MRQQKRIVELATCSLALAAIVVSGLVGLQLRFHQSSRPRFFATTRVVDLGQVPTDNLCPATFSFANNGQSDLELSLRQISCSCTVAPDATHVLIPPHQHRDVHAFIRSISYEDRFGSTLLFATNDPDASSVEIGITGRAVTMLRTDPAAIYFGRLNSSDLPRSIIMIIQEGSLADADTLKGLEIRCEDRHLHLSETRSTGTVKLVVSVDSSMPAGPFRSLLNIQLHSPLEDTVYIPVAGEIRSSLVVNPSGVIFGSVVKSGDLSSNINISNIPVNASPVVTYIGPQLSEQRAKIWLSLSDRQVVVHFELPRISSRRVIDDHFEVSFQEGGRTVSSVSIPVVFTQK